MGLRGSDRLGARRTRSDPGPPNPSLDVRNPDYMEIKSTSPNAPNRIIRLGLRLSF